jgi:hypothetical protein
MHHSQRAARRFVRRLEIRLYRDNYFRYFMFGKYNGFVSKARVSACMYFLVKYLKNRRIQSFACVYVRTKNATVEISLKT